MNDFHFSKTEMTASLTKRYAASAAAFILASRECGIKDDQFETIYTKPIPYFGSTRGCVVNEGSIYGAINSMALHLIKSEGGDSAVCFFDDLLSLTRTPNDPDNFLVRQRAKFASYADETCLDKSSEFSGTFEVTNLYREFLLASTPNSAEEDVLAEKLKRAYTRLKEKAGYEKATREINGFYCQLAEPENDDRKRLRVQSTQWLIDTATEWHQQSHPSQHETESDKFKHTFYSAACIIRANCIFRSHRESPEHGMYLNALVALIAKHSETHPEEAAEYAQHFVREDSIGGRDFYEQICPELVERFDNAIGTIIPAPSHPATNEHKGLGEKPTYKIG